MAPNQSTSSHLIPVGKLEPSTFALFGEVIQNPATHNRQPNLKDVAANQGTATKWLDPTHMTNHYHLSRSQRVAKVAVNMFVCRPRQLVEKDGKKVFPVEILERHPFTPQTFVPLGVNAADESTCYLIVVAPTLPLHNQPKRKRSIKEWILGASSDPLLKDFAPTSSSQGTSRKPKGPGAPDLANIQAFIARGDQAVTYGPGTWHAPMVVLGEKPIEFVVVQYANGVGVEDCQEIETQERSGGEGLGVDVTMVGASGVQPKAKL